MPRRPSATVTLEPLPPSSATRQFLTEIDSPHTGMWSQSAYWPTPCELRTITCFLAMSSYQPFVSWDIG